MKKALIAIVAVLGFCLPAAAVTLSSTTAKSGPVPALHLHPDETLTYTLTGTFTGTAYIEKSFDGTNWKPVGISSTNNSGATLTGTLASGKSATLYRWNGSTIAAGSFIFTMADNDDIVEEVKNNKKVPVTQTKDDSFNVLGRITSTGSLSSTFLILSSTFSIATTTPTAAGQIALDSNFDVYVSSGNQSPSQWIKVSGQ